VRAVGKANSRHGGDIAAVLGVERDRAGDEVPTVDNCGLRPV